MLQRLRNLWNSKHRRWLIALPIGFVIFSIGSVELTSQSFFCNSCHIMNPYYASWKKSTHKDVECVKCHISPGMDNFLAAKLNGLGQVVDDVLYRTSPKPSASVSQFSCTRSGCHVIEQVKQKEKAQGVFKFKHDKHLSLDYQGIKLGCGSCHSHVKGADHFAVNTSMCVTCHLIESPKADANTLAGAATPGSTGAIRLVVRESSSARASDSVVGREAAPRAAAESVAATRPPTSCVVCHNPPQGVIVRNGQKVDHAQFLSYGAACESCHRGTTAAPQPMDDSRCLECHTFGVDKSLPPAEMHKVHNEGRHKIECASCHGEIRHGPSAQTATMEQFDCRMCHSGQHGVQRQTYLADGSAHTAEGAAAVSPMFMSHVSCTGCHIHNRAVSVRPDSGATVAEAVAEACDTCHRAGMGAKMIPLWQKSTRKLYDQLAQDFLDAQDAKPAADPQLLAQTRKMLDLVRVDGSWGVHNPRYTQQLLQNARESLAKATGKPAPEAIKVQEPAPAGENPSPATAGSGR